MKTLLIILALLSAWEEVQQMVQRKSWKREDYRYPEWTTKHDSIWKNWDSHHFAFGLFVLVMFFAMSIDTVKWYYVPFYWFGFFQVRNLGMHVIFKKHPDWDKILKFWR